MKIVSVVVSGLPRKVKPACLALVFAIQKVANKHSFIRPLHAEVPVQVDHSSVYIGNVSAVRVTINMKANRPIASSLSLPTSKEESEASMVSKDIGIAVAEFMRDYKVNSNLLVPEVHFI